MAKIIAVTNQKGGVGKTTVSAHLAFALKALGKTVCMVDLDSQGHSSIYLSGDSDITDREGGSERIFARAEGLRGDPTPSGIDLLHGHTQLSRLDEGEYSSADAHALRGFVRALPYDYVVIDTPPALLLRQFAAIIWSDILVVVSEPEEKSLLGFLRTKDVVALLESEKYIEPGFKMRVLLNRVDSRASEHRRVHESLQESFHEELVPMTIPNKVIIGRAFSARVPVWDVARCPTEFAELFRTLPFLISAV
jgi:chromosome partitioning protein